MCIVTDYIGKYPLRTKQILGISYNQLRTLTASSILRHRELENLKENLHGVQALQNLNQTGVDGFEVEDKIKNFI